MKSFPYQINYFCCFLSLFAAVVSAMTHQLGFLIINFFFAVFNWYIAEYKRGLENGQDKRDTEDSGSDDSQDEE